jgi:hypothetical protein
LVKPLVPARTALIVVICPVGPEPAAGLPIVMSGLLAPLSKVSTFAPALPLSSSVQWLDCVVSLNLSCPMVRDESRLTVASAVRLSVAKSAMPEAPSATVPPDQLPVPLHNPPPVFVQVPLTALAALAPASAALTAATAGRIRRIRFRPG